MAQRHEIEAWVNPSAWDDEDEAWRVIDAIEESGSDDETDWVRIAGGDSDDEMMAAARDYASASKAADEARDRLRFLSVAAIRSGQTKVSVSERTGISRPTLDKWLDKS